MKIQEIITEQPNSYQAGKAFAQKLTSPSQWGLAGDKDYEGGKAFVNKLLDPSQWFKGNQTQAPTASTTQKSVQQNPAHINLGDMQPFAVKKNLDNLSSGTYYNQDIAVAKMFHDQLKSGTFKPSVDLEGTISSLKKILDGASLSPDDLERIKKLKAATKNLN